MKIPNPKDIAEQLVNVQPMPNDCLKGVRELSKSEQELRAEGYKPVSGLGLMWIKDDKEE
jgi:hypothetical protein